MDSKSSEEPTDGRMTTDGNDLELEVDQVSRNEDSKEEMEVDSKSREVPNNDPNDDKTIPEGRKEQMEESQPNIRSGGERTGHYPESPCSRAGSGPSVQNGR